MVKKQSSKTIEKKRPRRAFSPEGIGALLEAAAARPLVELSTIRIGERKGQQAARVRPEVRERAETRGRQRVVAYLLAIWTGLRRSELQSLQWRDITLDPLPARISLRAKTTKAKRADTIALHPQIAEKLRGMKPKDAKPGDRILPTVPSMAVLKADLKFAGVEFVTAEGRVDLHAMRKSLATMLEAHGVPQRITQAHLRHKDPRLTAGVYTDESLLPTAAAVSEVPWLPTSSEPNRQRAVATGTDDAPVGHADERAAHAQRAGRFHRQFDARTCAETEIDPQESELPLPSVDSALSSDMQDNSTKRVIGLEPTTFTLATCAR